MFTSRTRNAFNILLITKKVKSRTKWKKNIFNVSIYLLALVLKKEFTWSWLLIHFRQWQSNSSYQNDPCKKRKCLDVGWSPTRIWMYRHVRYRCILIANAQVGYEYCIFRPFLLIVKNSKRFCFVFDSVLIFGRKTERKAESKKIENYLEFLN